jgi:hypothetical protein
MSFSCQSEIPAAMIVYIDFIYCLIESFSFFVLSFLLRNSRCELYCYVRQNRLGRYHLTCSPLTIPLTREMVAACPHGQNTPYLQPTTQQPYHSYRQQMFCFVR